MQTGLELLGSGTFLFIVVAGDQVRIATSTILSSHAQNKMERETISILPLFIALFGGKVKDGGR